MKKAKRIIEIITVISVAFTTVLGAITSVLEVVSPAQDPEKEEK